MLIYICIVIFSSLISKVYTLVYLLRIIVCTQMFLPALFPFEISLNLFNPRYNNLTSESITLLSRIYEHILKHLCFKPITYSAFLNY